VRDAAFRVTWENWSTQLRGSEIDLRLLPINGDAIRFWQTIWPLFPSPGADGGFPWDKIWDQIRKTPRRFDLAIWNGPILCGLAAGMASRGNQGDERNVTVKFLERAGNEINPLAGYVAAICLDAAYAYGQALDKRMIYLKNPSTGAIPRYKFLGFSLARRRSRATYYGIEIERQQ
jgi:hypothetical protein